MIARGQSLYGEIHVTSTGRGATGEGAEEENSCGPERGSKFLGHQREPRAYFRHHRFDPGYPRSTLLIETDEDRRKRANHAETIVARGNPTTEGWGCYGSFGGVGSGSEPVSAPSQARRSFFSSGVRVTPPLIFSSRVGLSMGFAK